MPFPGAGALAIALIVLGLAAMAGAWWSVRRQLRRNALLEAAIAAVPRPRQVVGAGGRVRYSNPFVREVFGSADRPIPDLLIESLSKDDNATRARLRRMADNAGDGLPGQIELCTQGPDGEEVWRHVVCYPLPDWPGEVLWFADDVTLRRQTEAMVEQEQERFVDLLEHAPIGFYSVDGEGRFLFVNETLAEWLGRSPEELVEKLRLHDLLASPPQRGTAAHKAFAGGGQAGEVDLRAADGEAFKVLISEDVVQDGGPDAEPADEDAGEVEDAATLRTRSVVYHLSREQAAAEALERSERRFKRFFEEAPVGIAQLDSDGEVTECNKAFLELTGVGSAEVVGRAFLDFVREEGRPTVETAMEQANKGAAPGVSPQAHEIRLSGKRDVICQLSLTAYEDAAGAPSGYIAHLLDATEQKSLEAQFAQSQKMQAVGQLAGGVAHDFNNLLTAMIGFSDLLLLRHRPGDQSFADIMQIKQNANRAANLVRQLLAFSRQQTLQPRVLNFTDILAELSHLLRRLIGESIELQVVHGRDLGPVKADQGQLEQVIINLAVNARDAMENGGELTIRTSNVTLEEGLRKKGETVPRGDYVLVEVKDTGCGIPRENMDRIFDPFFSTKEVGEGTGLGLSTVYGIVKQTGGFVFVESEVGAGTTFSIYLPVFVEAVGQAPAEVEVKESRDLTGVGTVLLVEDEDAVRAFSARALRNKGYNVLEARSGEAALELLNGGENESFGDAIDLLITDVVMPKIDGPTLVKQVREQLPEMKVIFISGYTEDSFRKRLGEGEELHFLPKPFSLKQLAGKVKEVMDEPSH